MGAVARPAPMSQTGSSATARSLDQAAALPQKKLRLFAASRVLRTNADTPVQNQAEFATFMHAYQDMVFSTAARLTGNDAHAEDIAQEVFLKAYENFPSLRSSPTAGGWLKTVATRLTLNHLSRYRRRWRFFSEMRQDPDETSEVEFGDLPDSDLTADSIIADIDAVERHALVERALRELPEHHRVPLVLYHFEEMSYDEIAEQLRVSLPKVKTDIQRARAAMVKILARHGVLRSAERL
jgi:RNA polymerase sigma-70 factor (ECF subfamily)